MDQKRRTNVFIGSAIERVEDLRLVRGRGQFREHSGVHAIITAADMGAAIPTIPLRQDSSPEFQPFEQPVIAHDKVRYVGEPLALVLAESAAAAEDALDAIEVTI